MGEAGLACRYILLTSTLLIEALLATPGEPAGGLIIDNLSYLALAGGGYCSTYTAVVFLCIRRYDQRSSGSILLLLCRKNLLKKLPN